MNSPQHAYEIRPQKDHRGVDLISDVLPFGRLWYDGPNAASNAIGYRAAMQPITWCYDSRLR
jgi:hypothetical protein